MSHIIFHVMQNARKIVEIVTNIFSYILRCNVRDLQELGV